MNVWKIRPNLLIRGKFDDRPDRIQELFDLDVTTVICMLRKEDKELYNYMDQSQGLFRIFNFPISDSKGDPSRQSIDNAWEAARVATDAISNRPSQFAPGENVLIHCIGARDRAPFTTALTLHLLEGISGAEAMLRIKSKKRTTFYNEGYVKYLRILGDANYQALL
jgi:hypothetical protein